MAASVVSHHLTKGLSAFYYVTKVIITLLSRTTSLIRSGNIGYITKSDGAKNMRDEL